MSETPAPIAAMTADLAEVNRRWAAIVRRVIDTREHVQVTAGLSMAVWLAGVSKLPKAERVGLLVASDVLPSLPGVWERFTAGTVSWPVVSRICGRAIRLNPAETEIVDARMTNAIDVLAGDCTADAILDVLHELLAQLRAARERDRERRLERGEFVAMQPFLDGSGGSIYSEYGAVNFAAVTDAICAAAPQPATSPNPMGDPRIHAENRRSIGQARAQGLLELCTLLTRLSGGRLHLTATTARRLADAGCTMRLIVHDAPDRARRGRRDGRGRPPAVRPTRLAA